LRNHSSPMMLRSLFHTSMGLNKMKFRASPGGRRWALAMAVYIVYLDGVPRPFNRDINVKSPPSLPLYSARIRKRYDRFYIQVSTRSQDQRGVIAGEKMRCIFLTHREEKTQSRNYCEETARSNRHCFTMIKFFHPLVP